MKVGPESHYAWSVKGGAALGDLLCEWCGSGTDNRIMILSARSTELI